MKSKDFNKCVTEQVEKSLKLLTSKGLEYAASETEEDVSDRLQHFKKAAALIGGTTEQAIFNLMSKHIISISEMVYSDVIYPESKWDEKICDSINYLLILKAAIMEEKNEKH